MLRLLPILLLATAALAQDVYTPPVPIGIKREGKVRSAFTPLAFPAESTQWVRVRSPHYDVLSSASDEQTRKIVRDLETLASVLTKTTTRFRAGAAPTTVLVFAKREESRPWFELLLGRSSPDATGLYVRHGGGGTMFIDASRRTDGIEKTAMHELVHDLLRQSEELPPLWIEEGLAEYFSSATINEGKVTAGLPIRAHASLLRKRLVIPLAEMLTIQPETLAAASPAFYAQSWGAVDWLMRIDRTQFFPFLADLERGVPVADALLTRYGKTLRDLESGLRSAGNGSGFRARFEPEPVAIDDPSALDRPTLLYELGRFLSHVAGAEEDAQRHYREALRIEPRHARSLAATGQFEAAIAAGLNDPEVHLAYAETLLTTALGPFAGIFEPAEGDAEKFRKARALAERALALGASEGEARAAIGTTYFVETDLAPGIRELERAHALLPTRGDVTLNLYAMLLRIGDRARADALHAASLANTRDKQLVFAAKNVLLSAETARANVLAKAGKLTEAAQVVRALAAATDDPMGKRELEQQAASLESTAAVNDHIRMYNDAVALANTGRNRDAVKTLDQLLLVATDPQVVRDAKKLREDVRKR